MSVSVDLPDVTEAEIEEAKRTLEVTRKFFGGHYQPIDGFDLGPRDFAVMSKLLEERDTSASEIAGREDAGALTHDEAVSELNRLDEEYGQKVMVLLGDRADAWVEEVPLFAQEEALPKLEGLREEAQRKLERQTAGDLSTNAR